VAPESGTVVPNPRREDLKRTDSDAEPRAAMDAVPKAGFNLQRMQLPGPLRQAELHSKGKSSLAASVLTGRQSFRLLRRRLWRQSFGVLLRRHSSVCRVRSSQVRGFKQSFTDETVQLGDSSAALEAELQAARDAAGSAAVSNLRIVSSLASLLQFCFQCRALGCKGCCAEGRLQAAKDAAARSAPQAELHSWRQSSFATSTLIYGGGSGGRASGCMVVAARSAAASKASQCETIKRSTPVLL
jgi:hypothetical protein